MNKNKATFEVLKLQAEASQLDKVETMAFLSNNGVPLEVITRMGGLWEEVAEIAGQVINIGKIIIMKLIKFIRENPNMITGLVVGFGIGVAINIVIGIVLQMIVNSIPFIGKIIGSIISSIITPLLSISPVIFGAVGALYGHRLDKKERGEYVNENLIEDVITTAKKFLEFFCEIFNTLAIEPIMTGL